jgi:hypothetical protein
MWTKYYPQSQELHQGNFCVHCGKKDDPSPIVIDDSPRTKFVSLPRHAQQQLESVNQRQRNMSLKISAGSNAGSVPISSRPSNSTAMVTLRTNVTCIRECYKYLTPEDERYDVRFIENRTGFGIYILLHA